MTEMTNGRWWTMDRRCIFALLTIFVFCVMLTLINIGVETATTQNLLENKCEEVKNELGMIAAAVNADPTDPWDSHKDNILHFMAFLDAKPLTFAAAYAQSGSDLLLMTKRDNATNFDPRNFNAFRDAIKKNDDGEVVIGFTPTGGVYRDMYLYYMWVPDYSEPHERYLLVAAVSKFSITVKLARWVTIANLFGTVINVLLCLWNMRWKVILGHISDWRKGNKHRPLDKGE